MKPQPTPADLHRIPDATVVVSGTCESGRVTIITCPESRVPGRIDVEDEQVVRRWWEVPDTEAD